MNDLLKRLGVGVLIGLAVTMIVGLVVDKLPAVSKFLDKYEYLPMEHSKIFLNISDFINLQNKFVTRENQNDQKNQKK